jgi:AcrR family transcriptional regulator
VATDDLPLPRYLQLLWDREPAGRRGPKPGRTIQEIGAAGVVVADRDGLDGVSMKSVAAELGMTPMSLYRYVDSKEQLLEVMLDSAYGPADLEIVSSGTWRERLTRWAWALADALVRHPWISSTPMTSPPLSPNIIGWTEAGARSFERMALTNQQKMSSLLVVDGYVRSHVAMSVTMGFTAADAPPTDPYVTFLPMLLDAERFPALLAASPAITGGDGEEDFFRDEMRFGLDLILDGIEALTRTSPASNRE